MTRRTVLGATFGVGLSGWALRVPAHAADDTPPVTAPILRPASDLGTIQRFTPPTMDSRGPQLLFVDNPEALDDDVLIPSVLYRDTLTGWTRVMTHQQNQLLDPVIVETTATNTSSEDVDLWLRGRGVGLSVYPAVAGQVSTRDFITDRGAARRVATLRPGETWRDGDSIEHMITKSGLWELKATRCGNEDDDVAVLVGAVARHADVEVDPVTAPVTPITFSTLQRATYAHVDRLCTFGVDLRRGAQQIAFNGPGDPESQWYDPAKAIPGEYVLGTDVVDGNRPSLNNGNYAALYDLRIRMAADRDTPPTGIWIRPSGGPGNHVNMVNGFLNVSPYVRHTMAWRIGVIEDPLRNPLQRILLNLTGGSSGAQQLIFTPGITE